MLQTWMVWDRFPRFNDVLRPGFPTWTSGSIAGAASPLPDFYEDAERIIVTMELPGVQVGDLDVQVENRSLTIRGHRWRGEALQTYNQRWPLAAEVDADHAHASL